MARAGIAAIMAVAAGVMLGGCGTMANLSEGLGPGDKKIYGGVRLDASYGSEYADYPNHSEGFFHSIYAASTACAMAVDLPFSAVADTLTLPWTMTAPPKKASDKHPPKEDVDRTTPASEESTGE